jgi:glycosyltransferase involved in cell wall biosynthesis
MKHDSIAIFTWRLSGGAIANIASALAKGFWDLGVKEIYILHIQAGEDRDNNFPEGVKFVHLGVNRARWAFFPLSKFLKEVQPDVFISLAFLNFPAILGWMLAGKISTRLIISQQHSLIYKAYIEHKGNPLARFPLWLAYFLYPKVNGLVATTEALLEELFDQVRVSIQKERTTVIPNVVHIESIVKNSESEPDHPWLRQKQTPVILSVGRLAKQKNFPLLIKALAIVRQNIDVRLVILGEGIIKKELEDLAKELGLEEHVSLPGFSENPWSSMARADLFVLPSSEEAFGLVLVEAMACGVPVIATDAIGGGPRSVLEDGKYGILVPPDDAQALAKAMTQILTTQSLQKHLIELGKEHCEAFKPEIVAKQWLSFISQCE